MGSSHQLMAGFSLGDAGNYAVLFNATGNNQLQINSSPVNGSTVSGNIGIGGSYGQAQFNNPAVINGNVNFSGAANLHYNVPIYGTISANVSSVNNDLAYLNNLSATLGAESGNSIAINAGNNQSQTINITSGLLDGNGTYIFNVASLNLQNGGSLYINGNGLNDVVFNINSSVHFAGNIFLEGGLTTSDVLFNILGNSTLQTAANHATLNGTFLDMNGIINVNSVIINGGLYGGGGGNMQIVSGSTVFTPVFTPVPEPTTVLAGLLLLLPLGISSLRILRSLNARRLQVQPVEPFPGR